MRIDVPACGVAERLEIALRADQVALHLALVVDPAERQVGRCRRHGHAGDALQTLGAKRIEQERVAGDRHRRLGAAGRVEHDAGLEVRTGVEQHFLLVVRGFGEQLDIVGDFEAQAAEHAIAIVARLQADVAARVIDPPIATAGAQRHGAAADHREGQVAIDELVHRPALAEIKAAQPVGGAAGGIGDDAARSGVDRARAAHEHELRHARIRHGVVGRVLEPEEAERVPVTVDLQDAVAMGDLAAEQEVTAPARERHSARGVERIVEAVALVGDADVALELQPLIFVVEDEVDDARDRVGAIGRGGAAGHHFDAGDQRLGNGVHVDDAVDCRGHRAASVEQHERARPARIVIQVSQVELVDARLTARDIEARVGRPRRTGERRQRVDEVGDIVRRRTGLEFPFGNHRQRGRRLEAVADDARAGHDDPVAALLGGCIRRGRLGGGDILRRRVLRRSRLRRSGAGHCQGGKSRSRTKKPLGCFRSNHQVSPLNDVRSTLGNNNVTARHSFCWRSHNHGPLSNGKAPR